MSAASLPSSSAPPRRLKWLGLGLRASTQHQLVASHLQAAAEASSTSSSGGGGGGARSSALFGGAAEPASEFEEVVREIFSSAGWESVVADAGKRRLQLASGGSLFCIELDEAPSGTPAYMAPELWAHEGVCDGTDVWSFAVLACEAIAGERPMAQASTTELVIAALSGTRIPSAVWDVVEATVDSAVAEVFRSSLGRDRRARPTMSMVEEALSTWLHHASSST